MALPVEDEFDFSAFETAEQRRASAQKNKTANLTKYVEDKETAHRRRIDATVKSLKLVAVIAIIGTLAFLNLYAYSARDIADRKYDSLTEEYNMVLSDNQRLSMELNSMISLEQIEIVAVEELGLVKLDQSDIEYVKTSTGNKVVVSAGAATN